MKLLLVSDLHSNYMFDIRGAIPYGDIEYLGRNDVICIAGDVSDGPSGINKHLLDLHDLTDAVIVGVMGNHDFYHRTLTQDTINSARLGLPERVHILENEALEICGVRILGCTLWTDADRGQMAGNALEMQDFNFIKAPERESGFIEVEDMLVLNRASKDWLSVELGKPFAGKTVVMTHHAPSFRSQHPKYEGSPISSFFCCDMEYLIEEHGPELWLHGHLHDPVDYAIGHTRVVCNPRGYTHERKQLYKPQVIEI